MAINDALACFMLKQLGPELLFLVYVFVTTLGCRRYLLLVPQDGGVLLGIQTDKALLIPLLHRFGMTVLFNEPFGL